MLDLPMLLGAFQPPKPDNTICCDTHLVITGRSFHALYSSSIPKSVKVFECGIDRANEVELFLRAASLLVVFPSDGCANIFIAWHQEKTVVGPRGAGSVVEKLQTVWAR